MYNSLRIGIGVDAHKFSNTGILKLGCIEFKNYNLLDGDSDGDVVAHSIVDSLLSASKKGDIGSVFDIKTNNCINKSGESFLFETLKIIKPFKIINICVQIICKKPKILHVRNKMEKKLTNILNAPVSVVSTTTDNLLKCEKNGIIVITNSLIINKNE
jgi:2-C-methyl-D-erythritol 2,4-cyclodiphosphate synthase